MESFYGLNLLLTTTLVLRHPKFLKIFEVASNASRVGIGGGLSQESYMIACFSEKLHETS